MVCVNTKRCFKLSSDNPLGIQMRLKSRLLIWILTDQSGESIFPKLANQITAWLLFFSLFTGNPDTARISAVCAEKVSRNNSEDVAIYFAAFRS